MNFGFQLRLRCFGRDEKGAAAVEFALVAVFIMVPLLLGSVDLIDAMNANSRTQNVAASLADVVARDTEVSNDEVAGYWDALEVLIYPNNATDVEVRITSIRIVNATTATVVWSEGHGMTALNAGSSVTGLAAAMMNPGTSIIMAESSYTYETPMGFLFEDGITFRHKAYRRSRLVDPIPRVS
ncbi:MAG: pilus assembly protein [Phycisphaerales bacterium]|nr:pilus assembly protein [Hyphomonadaceae bacterium]